MLDLVVVGAGRAAGSLMLASLEAGHRVVGVLTRSGIAEHGPVLAWGDPLPPSDLVIVAVRDDAIVDVAARIAGTCAAVGAVVHVSGATSVHALDAVAAECAVGSFHPLQTMPDPSAGASALRGAWVAVTADEPLAVTLDGYTSTLGMRPFRLSDDVRRTYHAGATAAANFVVEALAVADDLFVAAGVPGEASRPLVERVVANVFELGAAAALTGPIARGDVSTVRAQIDAAEACGVGEEFVAMVSALAVRAGHEPEAFR